VREDEIFTLRLIIEPFSCSSQVSITSIITTPIPIKWLKAINTEFCTMAKYLWQVRVQCFIAQRVRLLSHLFVLRVYELRTQCSTYLRLWTTMPVGLMRKKAFLVVVSWNLEDFALAKNVSGHQMRSSISLLTHSSSLLSLNRSLSSYQCWRK